MLSNAYFLAKFRVDTAENEPAKSLQISAKFANFAPSPPIPTIKSEGRDGLPPRRAGRRDAELLERLHGAEVAQVRGGAEGAELEHVRRASGGGE